jgi:cob(I)alamin adenosyltransferase
MPRLTKIYTRTGDEGMTSLGGGQRVSKASLRVQVMGSVDELNSQLGVALAVGLSDYLSPVVSQIQNVLFDLGTDFCFLEEDKATIPLPKIEDRHVSDLEALIDELNAVLGPLDNFILPGGSLASAHLHVARTISRRAEREATALAREEDISGNAIAYLNRLSDALFVMARYENHVTGVEEPLWRPGE